ncbi:hypothetical protein HZC09_01315 [Candidatus Micrarchaeota archaeon]|nr:hypothetical protein [Candidatus Micrarchaeota archaeon]
MVDLLLKMSAALGVVLALFDMVPPEQLLLLLVVAGAWISRMNAWDAAPVYA